MRMHADQVNIMPGTVARLVAVQFPQWHDLPVRAVASYGTVNALFRLGDEIVLRFPLRPSLDAGLRDKLAAEQDTARRVAAHVPGPRARARRLRRAGRGIPGAVDGLPLDTRRDGQRRAHRRPRGVRL